MPRIAVAFACLLVSAWWSSARGQEAVRDRIHQNAAAMLDCFRTQQDEKFIDFVYPKMIELAGSREKMLAMLKSAEDDFKKQGVRIDSVEVGEPSMPVAAGGKQFSVVPQTMRLTLPGAKLEAAGYLLAVSTDEGKTWTFIDGAGVTPDTLKMVLPDLPPELKLPEKKQPKITPIQ